MVKKYKKAIAYEIMMIFLTLGVFAILYIVFGSVVQYIQQQNYPSGTFNPTYLNFVNQYWYWLPLIALFACVVYGFMKAQKRNPFGE